jgi:hypothetical protein
MPYRPHAPGTISAPQSDRASQRLAIAHQGVDAVNQGELLAHPLEQQGLERLHIELQEQVTERGIRRWLADLKAENIVEQGQMALLLRRSLRLGEPLHGD